MSFSKYIFLLLLFHPLLVFEVTAATTYEQNVLPIFKKHCTSCHNADESEAGLDLSNFKGAIAGSDGGIVLKPGLPDSSSLYLSITHHEDYAAMPPNKPKISEQEIKSIRTWISEGLIENIGGKSQLRSLSFSISAGSMKRPESPAFPFKLKPFPVTKTNVRPPVITMAVSPWANIIAVSGHQQVILYGTNEQDSYPSLIGTLPFPEGDIRSLQFSQNGELLIAGGGKGAESGKVALFDVKSGKRLATLADEYDTVLSTDISADHQHVAVGTTSKLIKIFSTKTGLLVHKIKKHTDWVTAVKFSPDGKLLATGDRNGGIYIWESQNAGIVYSLNEHKERINAFSWRPDSLVLASAGDDGKLILWDMKDGWATRAIDAHTKKATTRYSKATGVLDVCFSKEGQIVSSGRDKSIKLWNTDGSIITNISELNSLPLQVKFNFDNSNVLIGYFSGRLEIRGQNGKVIQELISHSK